VRSIKDSPLTEISNLILMKGGEGEKSRKGRNKIFTILRFTSQRQDNLIASCSIMGGITHRFLTLQKHRGWNPDFIRQKRKKN